MDNPTSNSKRRHKKQRHHNNEEDDDDDDEVRDPEVLASFNTTFRQVQSVLDRNRSLIQQVNENHQSRIADNMVKNVALIQELNGNISKVVSLYSDLNSNFSNSYHSHRDGGGGSGNNSNSSGRT
ncbi:protein EARLY FLOWERING 4 [Mercurialis annua]|uniref:protein EARLY FLOWERING 4 n=1 Tax=Mercurialis annua TaxID=3986 RepID=UPI0021607532|nr:protein EARLY FLOWERING 4 [Mercurialis annua]